MSLLGRISTEEACLDLDALSKRNFPTGTVIRMLNARPGYDEELAIPAELYDALEDQLAALRHSPVGENGITMISKWGETLIVREVK